VDPETGVQDAESPNTSSDRVVVPQRPALTPDGDVVVSDFTLDDMEGGLVSVDLPDGTQGILRQDRQLFNNPLGVTVVTNRAPLASVSASPAVVAGGRDVTFDASASTDPDGLQLRYSWDLDGNGSFEVPAGTTPTVTRAYEGTTTFTASVHVSDPHGASAVAGALVRVDSIRPVISALARRGSKFIYRLSEPAAVTIQIQRRAPGRRRWRTVRVLRQSGAAGRNRLSAGRRYLAAKPHPPGAERDAPKTKRNEPRTKRDAPRTERDAPRTERGAPRTKRGAPRAKRLAPGRYRAIARATDEVGNRAVPRRLRLPTVRDRRR
jgi:hypothetical protein